MSDLSVCPPGLILLSQISRTICADLHQMKPPNLHLSLSNKLSSPRDLHDCLDDMLQLPQTQKELAHDNNQNWADELLNSSLFFLDVCDTAKDALRQMKEQSQEVQSVLRRKRGDESELINVIKKFLSSREKSKKVLHKSLRNLKSKSSFSSLDNNNETTFTLLRRVEIVSFSLFESLLSYICGAKEERKLSSLSIVSKLFSCKETCVMEFDMVDAALSSIHVKTGKQI